MTGQDARKTQRLPALLGASISSVQKTTVFDCLIKNISDHGAMIKIDRIWDIPETFRLYIEKHDKSYNCRIRWKTYNSMGVSFS